MSCLRVLLIRDHKNDSYQDVPFLRYFNYITKTGLCRITPIKAFRQRDDGQRIVYVMAEHSGMAGGYKGALRGNNIQQIVTKTLLT